MNAVLELKGNVIYEAFLAGAKKLVAHKAHLNQINVFPVADGDTGNNMASLMNSIIFCARPSTDLSLTLDSIAKAAMRGSRGNSGIIFSEYLSGIAEGLKGKASAMVHELHSAIAHAVERAYKAIMNPVEGTILTVLKKAFDHNQTSDLVTYFDESLKRAKIALIETENELEVLKKNKVVDAGALGFTTFLEGIHEYLTLGISEFSVPTTKEVVFTHATHEEVKERFCTEAMFENVTVSQEVIKEIFKNEGSSLIVSGNQSLMRLHIHTNTPEDIFFKLRKYGTLIEQKVDDMIRQNQAIEALTKKIAIVTDSIADIPLSLKDKYHIHMIPVYLLVDGLSYLDQVSVSTKTFYHMIHEASSFSSSQPDQTTIERMLDFVSEQYEQVLVISVASALSGTYNAFKKYSETHPNVSVFDSRQNSSAEGQVVLEAAKLVQENKPLEEIIKSIEAITQRTNIYVSVNTLKYMVKQGRVSKVSGLLAKLMNLKPVISLDKEGKGVISDKAFSIHANERIILKKLKNRKIVSYALVHAMAENRCLKFASKIEKMTGIKPEYITEIGPVLAMNAGIGAVAVSVIFEGDE